MPPPSPVVVLELDDNSLVGGAAPFTNEPSVWSLAYDYNLQTRSGAEVFRALHEIASGSIFRGYPVRAAQRTAEILGAFGDSSEITWLLATEVMAARPALPEVASSVRMNLALLFDTIEAAANYLGPDRVRIVFTFV